MRSSVTTVLNEFILGAPFSAGEIAFSDSEYGAVTALCRQRAERDGLSLKQLVLPTRSEAFRDLTSEGLAALIVKQLSAKSKLLVLSHVMTGSGLKLPIREIARETRARGILLVVDGAHAPGAFDLDFTQYEDVDYYGGSLHKWVMAPKGTAFGWVPERNQKLLSPRQAGWTTYDLPEPFYQFSEGQHGFAARFLQSTSHDFAPFFGIPKTLELWKSWSPKAIHTRLLELQTSLEKLMEASDLNWPLASPENIELRGPLLSYELPARHQAQGFDLQRQILVAHSLQLAVSYFPSRGQGRWVLRFSPHIYVERWRELSNEQWEFERAVEILTKFY